MSESTKNEEAPSVEKRTDGGKSSKSFSINSILARVENEKKREECNVEEKEEKEVSDTEEKVKTEEDVPAVISKLEFPVFPGLGRSFADFSRQCDASAGGLLPLTHLPAWYHWYASQQSLQHWQQQQQQQKKCKHSVAFLKLSVQASKI